MAQKRVKKEIIRKIKLFAQKAKIEGIKIDSLILFGSWVKGGPKPYSDIDICVISSQFGKDKIEEAARLHLVGDEIDWRIEPHPLTPKDMKERENSFVYEILSTGIKIFK